MRSKTAKWFETKVKYEKMESSDGLMKTVKEVYVVDAESFSKAEMAILTHMGFYHIACDIVDIKPTTYKEIFFSDDTHDQNWYKAKVQEISADDKNPEKEKRVNRYYLVQAANISKAVSNIDAIMGKTMLDYVIVSLTEAKIEEVIENDFVVTNKTESDDVPEYEQQPAE